MRVTKRNVLACFVERGTASWASQAVPLPARLGTALSTLIGVNVAAALWIFAVHRHTLPCATALCSVTTLGGRETALGLTAAGALLGLLLLAVPTGGFRRGGTFPVVRLCVLCVAAPAAASAWPWPRAPRPHHLGRGGAARLRLRVGPDRCVILGGKP